MANFYRIGAAGLNWKNTGSWSSTSGGASNGVDEPTSTDDVFFDDNSPATVTVNSAASGLSLTLAKTSQVITLNGGDITISGLTTIFATRPAVINKTASEKLTTAGLTVNAACSGTALIVLSGGTWSGNGNTLSNDLTINGTVTASGTLDYSTGTITFDNTGGPYTVATTGSTLRFRGNSTLNTSGIDWNNITIQTASTLTLTSNFSITGLLTISTNLTLTKTASETVTLSGGVTVNNLCSGTAKIILTGGTWSGTNTTGISNNLDLQGNVTISGNVYYRTGTLTYVSGTITVTSSTLNITGSCTLNINGMSWNNVTTNAALATVTLTSNFTMNGLWTISTAHTINKTTSETWTVAGGITMNGGFLNGTLQELIVTGGTLTQIDGTEGYYVNFTINGNVTISNRLVKIGGVLKYDSTGGPYTVTTTGSNLRLNGTVGTLNTNGITWNTISTQAASAATYTLTSNLTCSSTLTITTAATFNRTASETITINGLTQTGGFLSGTAEIFLVGGTWTGTVTTTGVTSNLTIKPDNSNVTISTNVYYSGGTLKFTSSTFSVITTSSTLNIVLTASLDTSGITWNNITLSNTTGSTYTINSTLTASGTLTIGTGSTTTFAGTAGFSCFTLLNQSTAATTVTLKDGVTYTVTGTLDCKTTRVGAILAFTSSHASNKAILTLQRGATCQCLASFTRIDASGGRPIRSFNGVITDCVNVVSFFDLKTVVGVV